MSKEIQLYLYKGHCDAEGVSEGRFYPGKTDPHFNERYLKAIHTVQKYLQYKFGLHIYKPESLTKSEKSASELIKFAEQNMPGAEGFIKLLYCNHGRILFERKIRFKVEAETQIKDLIEKFKNSEYKKNTIFQILCGNFLLETKDKGDLLNFIS